MLGKLWRRARTLLGARRFDDDVQRELAFHIARETEARQAAGLSADEARRTALRDFGGVSRVREEVRDARGLRFWDTAGQDARYALRTLSNARGYAATATLILALGIGANTAMFSVIKGVLLAPLPFRSGEELVVIQHAALESNRPTVGVSIQEVRDYRLRLGSVRDLVEYHSMSFTLLNQGEPDRVDTGVVSANFFDMLGIQPVAGRSFADGDDDLGAEAVLILSHAYWQEKFGGDPAVIGRVLEMNNKPHTVVGVLPAFPQYPRDNDVYMPTSACPFRAGAEEAPGPAGHRAFGGLRVFGRLAPDTTVERASSEIATIARSFEQDYPAEHELTQSLGFTGAALPLGEQLVTNARAALYMLAGVTMLVLIIACANVANLSLARTLRRGRELSVRTALGASRGRLARQLLTESVILAMVGGVLGVGLAWASLDLLVAFVGRFTPRTGQITMDSGVLVFALVASVATGVIFGLAPAFASRRNLSSGMREGGAQAGDGTTKHRVRSGLVVAQVAVSFALVVGAALLLQSFYRVATTPLGFETEQVMTAAVFGNFTTQATAEDSERFESAVLARLRSSPGVRAAALTGAVPQSAISPGNVPAVLQGAVGDMHADVQVDVNFASDQYFETLGVPMVAGRDFRPGDTRDAPPVAIINQSMAALWNGADPIGRHITTRLFGAEAMLTVVGIASDYRLYGVEQANPAQFYVPVSQSPGTGSRVLVRTDGDPRAMAPVIKAAVYAADPNTPVEELATISEIRGSTQLAPRRLTAALLAVFAFVALVMTLAGIGGVIGTTVSQRTREFGLRMALGASRFSVLRLVLGQGLVLATVGIALGVAGAYFFSQLLSSFLFETSSTDVSAHLIVAALFIAAAILAALGPARRATGIDPLTALRSE